MFGNKTFLLLLVDLLKSKNEIWGSNSEAWGLKVMIPSQADTCLVNVSCWVLFRSVERIKLL
jgi:hypothetical protein